MKIKLKSNSLLNFKGIRELSVDFRDETFIYGANETGKTTIVDAFMWLLFGKNSEDKKDFEIKTLDANNAPIHKLTHEVSATFDFDGSENVLRRVYKEKWVKKRGEETAEFSGHVTEFFWNDVPMTQKEYGAAVSDKIDESLFKLITNPLYFNSLLKWQDRRATLTKMAGDISKDDVLASIKGDVSELTLALNAGKTIDQYRRELAAKKKKIKDSLDGISPRIDEVKRGKPEVKDWGKIEAAINSKSKEVDEIDKQLESLSDAHDKAYEDYNDKRQELSTLRTSVNDLKRNADIESSTELRDKEGALKLAEQDRDNILRLIETGERNKERYTDTVGRLEEENKKLRDKWSAINEESFNMDEGELSCPTCNAPLEEAIVETKKQEFESNFNVDKDKRLKAIRAKGQTNNQQITDAKNFLTDIDKEITDNKSRLEEAELAVSTLKTNVEELSGKEVVYSSEIKNLEAKLEAFVLPDAPKVDNAQLKEDKSALIREINEYRIVLGKKDEIDKADKRIAELEEQETSLSQELAGLEGIEFTIDAYVKAEVDLVTERINGMFNYVSFKMFEEQINGGTRETCVALINGVPFSDANTASKINAGIDVINALTKHYDTYAPIFIDNRESVTNIIPTESQLVSLIVSPEDKQLRIDY